MTTLSEPSRRHVKRATMNDVARLAGVSLKTVSRVVNGEPGVHHDTAARVQAAIERLGFRRNAGARNLRRGVSTGTIGIITEDVANPFYSAMIRAIECVARAHGRRVLTASSDEDPDQERELVLDLCSRRVDGLVIGPAGGRHSYLAPEMSVGMPVVFVDRPPGDILADTVLADDFDGSVTAVRHLARHGHRRLAFIGDTSAIYTANARLEGFRAGCKEQGLRVDDDLVVMGPHDAEGIASALHQVLDATKPATGLITGNNRITVAVLRVLANRPAAPAIIGFDDFELADLLDPPVSVISHEASDLGDAAARLLFARLDGDDSPPKRVTLPVELIARGSAERSP